MSQIQESALYAANAGARGGNDHGLNTLGVVAIASYIFASASSFMGVITIVPIMLRLGTGAGSPEAFLLATTILMLFAVGYVAMSLNSVNLLIGMQGIWSNLLALFVFAVSAAGWIYGVYIKKFHRQRYARLITVLLSVTLWSPKRSLYGS